MTTNAAMRDVERFRSIIAARLGLSFDDARLAFLGDVLDERATASGRTSTAYLERLRTDNDASELGALAQRLTVPETYFYRNEAQFRAFEERVLPERRARIGPTGRLRLLSAGCASGEEPCTLAMILCDVLTGSQRASVLAVDVNPAALAKARRGRFTAWALRGTPDHVRERWFRNDGREMLLVDQITNMVDFEWRNLVDDDPELWARGAYDVVFCRNVLMYFTPEQAKTVVDRICTALAPGGFLFLGHAETLRGLSTDFHLCHSHGTFYYQRREQHRDASAQVLPTASELPATEVVALTASVSVTDTWLHAIQAATDRVRELVASPRAATTAPVPAKYSSDLGPSFELLRLERFAEALDLIESLPSDAATDVDVLLVHAALLIHGGSLDRAEDACQRLLAIDELSAGAHYLLALCREGAHDRPAAVDHDQTAAYLDPSFAMPRLHRGLLARRVGDFDTMRRELRAAIALLQREDSSRLLLFGGGFSRHALIALCEAELAAGGGPA